MGWTPENIERVRTLAAAGFSASQVAASIGGVSRNAVIGVAHRNSIQFYGGAGETRPQREPREPKSRPYKAPLTFTPIHECTEVVGALMISFDELQFGDCKFPYGERDFKFCGLPALEGRSWCLGHARICHSPTPERRR
jgi:GcrA cell cycle regulator